MEHVYRFLSLSRRLMRYLSLHVYVIYSASGRYVQADGVTRTARECRHAKAANNECRAINIPHCSLRVDTPYFFYRDSTRQRMPNCRLYIHKSRFIYLFI